MTEQSPRRLRHQICHNIGIISITWVIFPCKQSQLPSKKKRPFCCCCCCCHLASENLSIFSGFDLRPGFWPQQKNEINWLEAVQQQVWVVAMDLMPLKTLWWVENLASGVRFMHFSLEFLLFVLDGAQALCPDLGAALYLLDLKCDSTQSLKI